MAANRRLVVTIETPDDATPVVKEALTRRRLVALTGTCPCGAVLQIPDHLQRGAVTVVAIDHKPGCPAAMPDSVLLTALRASERPGA